MGSPFRSTRHDVYNLPSSPDLPSLDQIKSQFPKKPPIRSPIAAVSSPSHASHHFTSASRFLRQEQPAIDLTTPCRDEGAPPRPQDEEEEVTVISIANVPKPKRKRGVKVLEKKAYQPPPPPKPIKDASASPPWKKYAEPKKTSAKAARQSKTAKPKTTAKKGGVQSRHFAKPKNEGKEASPPSPKEDVSGPLELEAAMRRRVDWTPPPADNGLSLGSKPSQATDLHSSTAKSPSRAALNDTFDNLFGKFGRPDEEPKRPSAEPSDGDTPVLKKRKLIETMPVNQSSKMGPPQKGALKVKAPRKKPRTITGLATAAYAVPDPTEQERASGLRVDSVHDGGETVQSKGKARASKAKKSKKAPPPEPVLLSPNAALRQAAKQDYVFGTSSQLAREHSPTFLRDLQSALQASNSLREDPFVTPINSDAVEPEPKQKLWDVGARDEDGRLLDLDVINLADTPQAAPDAANGLNPFGYAGIDQIMAPPPAHIPSDVSFPDIDYLLGNDAAIKLPPQPIVSTQEKVTVPLPAHILSDMSFPDIDDLLGKETRDDDMLRSQKEASPSSPNASPAKMEEHRAEVLLVSSGSGPNMGDEASNLPFESPPTQASEASKPSVVGDAAPEIAKPDFSLYTDNQLAREISSFGFKPVKRRQAMLALLDQCWVGKQRIALAPLPTNHPISTTSQAQAAAAKSQKSVATVSPKRPRGRPRKNSQVEVELPSSEPPPSAQPPPPSPKRGRGRPRKNVEPAKATASKSSKKGTSKPNPGASNVPKVPLKAASPVASPPRKKTKVSEVIEIPDSASEGSLSLSPSPCSSPESTFSPAPEEASVSIGDDTEMSLAASQSQQPEVLFARITAAVTSAPPTTDPKQPSFHEMMLMYDPIVLEDLATWLNTGQLSRVGYDGEVSPTEVKQWCESKSVCCLWRESLRGKERKRY
ncbi:AT hook domain-containing protein [Colletotrichum orchidophilum]|uniref:Structure-specific endonuclease subunit SLX4 n=1 Tax=Colletotrichum orchidophilum TaxID=1209926 RepID=A0A1G4BJE8_9PEZI|nr:AT hook domain-containing protein [Colletotrichum orchidophilum]OHF01569.1 AT hook domain-containing protein [Colletotrichum orchidophilum]